MLEAVIFDIDGTLLDSNDVNAYAWREAFLQYGKDIPAPEIRASIGKGGDNLLPDFFSEEEIGRFGEEMTEWRTKRYADYLPSLKPFTFARELGQKLKENGIRLALASSAKGDELQKYKELIGFTDLIEAETSSDDADHSKPDPDIFLAALDHLGNPNPQRVLVVGDTPYDATAAGKAGLKTIGVLCGGFSRESLEEPGCIALYQSPSELLLRYDETPFAQPIS